jgi:DHA1 family multidrug resistance protein-like MFS transporter
VNLSWRSTNLLFLGCAALQFMTEGHIAAFTPLLLHEMGLSDGEIGVWTGLLFAIMMSTAFPLAPFWGVLAERFSRRWVVLRSYYFLSAALLVTAWAPDVSFLIPARLLMGLCFGTIGVILGTQAMLTPPRQLGSAIATIQAAQPIAASLGPPLGAIAIPLIGLRGLFVADAAINLLGALTLTLLMPEPAERVKKGSVLGRTGEVLRLVWSTKPIRWNFSSGLLLRGATSVVDTYLPVRIAQLAADPAAAIGWILGIYGALTTAATWLAGRVVDRVDPARLYWRVMLFALVVTAGLAVAPWLWLLGLFATLRSIPVAFSNTVLFAHIARVLPPELHTPIFSLAPMPRNLGAFLLPLMAASVAGLAPGAALAVGAVAYGGTFLAGLQMSRVTRRSDARPAREARQQAGPHDAEPRTLSS